MPSVNISGEITIGEGVYVGTGAKIIRWDRGQAPVPGLIFRELYKIA